MNKPYIGITGFVTAREVAAILDDTSLPPERMLMVGVLASANTLNSRQPQWPRRYPVVGDLAGIFTDHPLTFNLVHYSTDTPEFLSQQLMELTGLGGPNLHGYQLNIAWPPATELGQFRAAYPHMKIVLQINNQALDMVSRSPAGLVDKLARHYSGLVDYVLLDPSAGFGVPLDPDWARTYLEAIREANLGIGMGVAGGLSPATLELVKPLAGEFPGLSIDAESQLRDGNDDLDVSLARAYIGKALELFSASHDLT